MFVSLHKLSPEFVANLFAAAKVPAADLSQQTDKLKGAFKHKQK